MVGHGEGCPLPCRLGGLGEHCELPSGVRGGALARNAFWRILKATERSFLHLYAEIFGGRSKAAVWVCPLPQGRTAPDECILSVGLLLKKLQ